VVGFRSVTADPVRPRGPRVRPVAALLLLGGAAAATVATSTIGSAAPLLVPARVSHHLSANPNLAFVLLVLGMAGIIFELFHPGLNLPGVLGLLAFIVSLILLSGLPVRAIGVILLVVALACFIVELKSGAHAIAAALGTVALILGGLFFYDPSVPNARVSRPLLIGIAVVLGAFFILVARAALQARNAPVVTGSDTLVGEEGVVTKALEPDGQVRVRGEVWAATLDSPTATAPVGSKIVVWDLRGLTLLVAPADHMTDGSGTGSITER
jgi:membrane-bound serine protease (ClpP class)